MVIPKVLKVGGIPYEVVWTKGLRDHTDCDGMVKFSDQKILMQKNVPGFVIERETQEMIFCHEIVHIVLKHISEDKLCADEGFVVRFSRCLYEILINNKMLRE
jgi:hypothetical protein